MSNRIHDNRDGYRGRNHHNPAFSNQKKQFVKGKYMVVIDSDQLRELTDMANLQQKHYNTAAKPRRDQYHHQYNDRNTNNSQSFHQRGPTPSSGYYHNQKKSQYREQMQYQQQHQQSSRNYLQEGQSSRHTSAYRHHQYPASAAKWKKPHFESSVTSTIEAQPYSFSSPDWTNTFFSQQPKNGQNQQQLNDSSVAHLQSISSAAQNQHGQGIRRRQHQSTAVPQSILSETQAERITQLENEITACDMPKKPLSGYQIFENKNFNDVKQRMPHLSKREISEHLRAKWNHKLTQVERSEFELLADESQKDHFSRIEEVQNRVNELREQIHCIKFCNDNQAVKPTGKLKFLTAYRFYRREEVPIVKQMFPDKEGKERQALVRKRWQALPDEKKFAYVMMSRMDRERAIYMNKLTQIKQNLLAELPSQTQTPKKASLPSAQPQLSQQTQSQLQFQSVGDLARNSLLYDGLAAASMTAAMTPSTMGTAPSSATGLLVGTRGGTNMTGRGAYGSLQHSRDLLMGTRSSLKTSSKAFTIRPKNTPEQVAEFAVRRIDKELNNYHRHMVRYANSDGICVEEMDDDSDDESDASEKVAPQKKIHGRMKEDKKDDNKQKQHQIGHSQSQKSGIKSCPTADVSSIQANYSNSPGVKSAFDQLFGIKRNHINIRSPTDTPPEDDPNTTQLEETKVQQSAIPTDEQKATEPYQKLVIKLNKVEEQPETTITIENGKRFTQSKISQYLQN